MAIYRFRVSFEDHDDVYREIEVRSNQTFLDLHHAIQSAIGFKDPKPSSFFMSNDHWKKGEEISDRSDAGEKEVIAMNAATFSDFISDPHQKIYYHFDLSSDWTFHIELARILPRPSTDEPLPACTNSVGEAPKQYFVVEPHKGAAATIVDEVGDSEEDETEDEESNDDQIDTVDEVIDEQEYDNIEDNNPEEYRD